MKSPFFATLLLITVPTISVLASDQNPGSPIRPQRAIDPISDFPEAVRPEKDPLEGNIFVLEKLGIHEAALPRAPWAAHTWFFNKGLIAERFREPGFEMASNFHWRKVHVTKNPLQDVLKLSDPERRLKKIQALSASEKYDLLVGDRDATLTQAIWREAEKHQEPWMGICEGASAASVHFREPTQPVLMPSALDPALLIPFDAYDIKALTSLLWSAYVVDIPVSGTRCQDFYSDTPSDDPACFNVNPAVWHQAVLEWLGRDGRPIVADISKDPEVWNMPLKRFSFRYFNPKTKERSDQPEPSIVKLTDFSWWRPDRFASWHAPGTESVIGVVMEAVFGRSPEHVPINGSTEMGDWAYEYQYDLELDARGNILGGEWRSDLHPDFIWGLRRSTRPLSVADLAHGNPQWTTPTVPAEWLSSIRLASDRLQPMAAIVQELVRRSAEVR